MWTINLRLAQLQPASWNANRMNDDGIARLRESMTRFGVVQNLVARSMDDGNSEVLSGNQRLQVLRELGQR